MKKIILLILILAIGLIGLVAAAYVFELIIPGNVIVGETPEGEYEIQAFQDVACSIPFSTVDWGSLQPGGSKYIDFYVKNTGDTAISGMTVEVVSDVQYSGPLGYGGLVPQQSEKVTAVLSINPQASPGQFSASIKITCTA